MLRALDVDSAYGWGLRSLRSRGDVLGATRGWLSVGVGRDVTAYGRPRGIRVVVEVGETYLCSRRLRTEREATTLAETILRDFPSLGTLQAIGFKEE